MDRIGKIQVFYFLLTINNLAKSDKNVTFMYEKVTELSLFANIK